MSKIENIQAIEIVDLARRADAAGQPELAVILFTLAGSLCDGSVRLLVEPMMAFSRARLEANAATMAGIAATTTARSTEFHPGLTQAIGEIAFPE